MDNYYRPGHVLRPSREWEVWDERWLRGGSERRNGVDTDDRWVIHHPIELAGAACFCDLDFESLNEALAYIAQFEADHAVELAAYRALNKDRRGAA